MRRSAAHAHHVRHSPESEEKLKSRPVIDVRIERGPSAVETRALGLSPSLGSVLSPYAEYHSKPRGLVRLVIEMPAGPVRMLPLILAVVVAYGAGVAVIALALGEIVPFAVILPVAVVAVGSAVVAVMRGWPSRREVLEVDSRFVTVKRGGRLLCLSPRARVTSVALATEPASRFSTLLRLTEPPQLLLGAHGQIGVLAGRGISRSAASELLPTIEQFLEDTPLEDS